MVAVEIRKAFQEESRKFNEKFGQAQEPRQRTAKKNAEKVGRYSKSSKRKGESQRRRISVAHNPRDASGDGTSKREGVEQLEKTSAKNNKSRVSMTCSPLPQGDWIYVREV